MDVGSDRDTSAGAPLHDTGGCKITAHYGAVHGAVVTGPLTLATLIHQRNVSGCTMQKDTWRQDNLACISGQ